VGNDPVNINLLGTAVEQRLQGSNNAPVFIRADQSVPFGTFARVVDTLKQANVSNINIVTEPLSTKGS